MKRPRANIRNLRAIAVIVLVFGLARCGIAGSFTLLHTFTGNDGNSPVGGLFWLGDGNFYGATTIGGANSEGTIFSFSPLINMFNSVYDFANDTGGFGPHAGVTAFNGKLLGVSYNGGTGNAGVGAVFRLSQAGPTWGLGNWYDFTNGPDGGNPEGALVRGSDGYFYGTTAAGGTNGYTDRGVVFQLNPTNFTLSTLYQFSGGSDGYHPNGALVEGNDGRFYGVTRYGGGSVFGTVFSIGRVNVGMFHFWSLTTLHQFTGTGDGGFPNGGLVLGTDGLFYGTTDYGGTNGSPTVSGGGGTVYKIDSSGNMTLLHSFGDDYPQPLIQGTDGNFYGTTANGSSVEPYGTVFQIAPGGAFTTLWEFSGTNGSNPAGALIQFGYGYLYGTTSQGGSNNLGTIFSLYVPSLGAVTNQGLAPVHFREPQQASVGIVTGAGLMYQLQSMDSLSQDSWNNVGSPVEGGGGMTTLTDPGATVTARFYRVMISTSP